MPASDSQLAQWGRLPGVIHPGTAGDASLVPGTSNTNESTEPRGKTHARYAILRTWHRRQGGKSAIQNG